MPEWRERIQAARARGHFTGQDRRDADYPTTCAVGEVAAGYGQRYGWFARAGALHCALGGAFPLAVECNDFDRAERVLDEIEDRAHILKMEATHG